MARIVYGVSGEGSGHSSRASEIAAWLEAQGHEVRLASYDRGYRNLKDRFTVIEISGLHIVSEDNRVARRKTLRRNLAALPNGIDSVRGVRRELFEGFRPDCVITDFEPTTAYLAKHYRLPLISIDNQHRMRYMRFPCPRHMRVDAAVTKTVIRAMVPRPTVALVTTFYFGEVKNTRTFLFPPILRRAVLDSRPREGTHCLVYATAGHESLLHVLRQFRDERFLVYGYEREGSDGPLEFRPFSKDGFLDDLAGCKAVIATAGFTLITEALHLGKPYLALPMAGQFEQMLNGVLLEAAGLGRSLAAPDVDEVGAFLAGLDDYRAALSDYPRADNRAILAKLEELLDDDLHLLRYLHKPCTSC